MPGEIESAWNPYPAKDNVVTRFQGLFHGDQGGTARSGSIPPGAGTAGIGGGDPMARYPGKDGTDDWAAAKAEQIANRPEEMVGGSFLRLDLPLATGDLSKRDERAAGIQRLLSRAGFQVDDDGVFGTDSMGALNEFIHKFVSPDLTYKVGDEIAPEILMALWDAVPK